MAKFKCVKGFEYVPEGTILEGVQRKDRLILTKPSELLGIDGNPRFSEGDDLPMVGNLWAWEEVKEK
ncbi:TPA: hypothetical protein ACI7LS_004075 [Escherichia coli]